MIDVPDNCTGCTACISICPKHCIGSTRNKYGFPVPKIDPTQCTNCGLCEKVCPASHGSAIHASIDTKTIYAAQNPDKTILKESSSGGVFSMIAAEILSQGGLVFGAAIDYDDHCKIKHIYIDDVSRLPLLRGSKYVQSDLAGIFIKVKRFLSEGKQVLFSGTPCQISGLKRFLMREYENLTTLDIICHGVPSPMAWEKYISERQISPRNNMKYTWISFREKYDSWMDFGISFRTCSYNANGKFEGHEYHFDKRYNNPFMKGFLEDLYLRDSCYDCPVKGLSSRADITLGDAWGIQNYDNDFNINDGISVVICNTDKGSQIISNLNLVLNIMPSEILTVHNPAYLKSPKKHPKRKKFFKLLAKGIPFDKCISICLPPPTYIDKVIWSIKRRIPSFSKEK